MTTTANASPRRSPPPPRRPAKPEAEAPPPLAECLANIRTDLERIARGLHGYDTLIHCYGSVTDTLLPGQSPRGDLLTSFPAGLDDGQPVEAELDYHFMLPEHKPFVLAAQITTQARQMAHSAQRLEQSVAFLVQAIFHAAQGNQGEPPPPPRMPAGVVAAAADGEEDDA